MDAGKTIDQDVKKIPTKAESCGEILPHLCLLLLICTKRYILLLNSTKDKNNSKSGFLKFVSDMYKTLVFLPGLRPRN